MQYEILIKINIWCVLYRSMDGGMEEDEYTSDPIAQQTRQVSN